MEHILNCHEDHPYQHENGHKLYDETGHPFGVLWKVNVGWDNIMIKISQWMEPTVERIGQSIQEWTK